MVGVGAESLVSRPSGGRRRQVLAVQAEWWVPEPSNTTISAATSVIWLVNIAGFEL